MGYKSIFSGNNKEYYCVMCGMRKCSHDGIPAPGVCSKRTGPNGTKKPHIWKPTGKKF